MELKEAIKKVQEEKRELEKKLSELFIEFTNKTGVTVYTVNPNAIYNLQFENPIDYEPKIELLLEK